MRNCETGVSPVSERPRLRIRWISLAAACLLALPLHLGVWDGILVRTSPWLFLESLLARAPLTPLAVLGAFTTALIVWKNRWFCRFICPTGALCDGVSGRRRPNPLWRRLPPIHRLLALAGLALAAFGFPVLGVLDPMAFFQSAWAPLHFGFTLAAWGGTVALAGALLISWWAPYIWCRRLCPLGGLQELATDFRRLFTLKAGPVVDQPEKGGVWQRREVLAIGMGVAGGWVLKRLGKAQTKTCLRPPGSQPEAQFLATCCRCTNCNRACPTHIISPSTDLSPGLLSPRLGFSRGYCLPDCNACGQVCPTGAIRPFSVAEKPALVIGKVLIQLDGCLLTQNKECDRCKSVCPYHAITIAGDLFTAEPSVQADRCTGCGACATVCPPRVISIYHI